ncbi:hypothetical protein, partial [Syntrophomonas wolfei]|uniref:hypothetical protein n=1 Tax=Syntrophomonas wolfei TaxID=863 RepID=UPI0023F512B4
CRSPPFACSPSPGVATMLRQRSLCIFMQPLCNKKGVFAVEPIIKVLIIQQISTAPIAPGFVDKSAI